MIEAQGFIGIFPYATFSHQLASYLPDYYTECPEGMEKPDYTELIEGCRKGDRAAQRSLYNALASKMFAVCIRYMGSRDEAQDILQDGFVTLFTKMGDYDERGSFEGWARKIFVNTALMSLRKNDALKVSDSIETAWGLGDSQPTPVQEMGYKEMMRLVMSLPAGYRTVFNMFAVEGYSHKEIAEALGITSATSRSQLNRARQMLQEMIKNRT